jgi:Tfp pilus assembly protein PilZ
MARVAKRARRRLACRIVVARQRFSGVILDLSASGIFVQTNAKPRPGDPVSLELSVPGQREPLRLEAQVARVKVVPPRLVAVAQGGLGLRITNAPEGYFDFLTSVLPEIAAAADEEAEAIARELGPPVARSAPPPATRRYRVHVSQVGGARSRTLRLEAASAEEAGALALESAGDGWKLLGAVLDEERPG